MDNLKQFVEIQTNRKEKQQELYQKNIAEGFSDNDAKTQARQEYESMLLDCLKN